jgi:hypothetical protein
MSSRGRFATRAQSLSPECSSVPRAKVWALCLVQGAFLCHPSVAPCRGRKCGRCASFKERFSVTKVWALCLVQGAFLCHESVGVVPRSRRFLCRPVPNPIRIKMNHFLTSTQYIAIEGSWSKEPRPDPLEGRVGARHSVY